MSFLPLLPDAELEAAAIAAADRQLSTHGGRITNMKRTLLGHVPSFDAYMEWYTLKDELVRSNELDEVAVRILYQR